MRVIPGRGPQAREPGIHTIAVVKERIQALQMVLQRLWLWIPGSPLCGAPGMTMFAQYCE
jgi:hypothetical protein